jgi:hypothetical protein
MGYLPEMWRDFGVTVAGLIGGVINAWLFLVRVPPSVDGNSTEGKP